MQELNLGNNHMRHNVSITIVKSLELDDIKSGQRFPHRHVLDLRGCGEGNSRPIEEPTLKCLHNHFIDYEQACLNLRNPDEHAEMQLMNLITQKQGDILVITDQVSQMADYCMRTNIPFVTKDFYIVETGKGGVVKHVPPQPAYNIKFGAFVS